MAMFDGNDGGDGDSDYYGDGDYDGGDGGGDDENFFLLLSRWK